MSMKSCLKRAAITLGAYAGLCAIACLIILPFAGYANFWEYSGLAAAVIFIVFSAAFIILTVRRAVLIIKLSKAAELFETSPEGYIKALGEMLRYARFPEDKFIINYNMAAAEAKRGDAATALSLLKAASELSVSKRNLALCRDAMQAIGREESNPNPEE